MIEIISGKITPANEETGEPESLTVFIKIDGKDYSVGGLESSLTKAEIQQILNGREQEFLDLMARDMPNPVIERLDLSLPSKSEHIGKLLSVNPSLAKPAVVRRRFYGENYDVNCLVTQSVKDMFQAGDLQVNDYVLVSFIEEIPNTTERKIAIVTDKVFESW